MKGKRIFDLQCLLGAVRNSDFGGTWTLSNVEIDWVALLSHSRSIPLWNSKIAMKAAICFFTFMGYFFFPTIPKIVFTVLLRGASTCNTTKNRNHEVRTPCGTAVLHRSCTPLMIFPHFCKPITKPLIFFLPFSPLRILAGSTIFKKVQPTLVELCSSLQRPGIIYLQLNGLHLTLTLAKICSDTSKKSESMIRCKCSIVDSNK